MHAVTGKTAGKLNLASLQQLPTFTGPAPSALVWKGYVYRTPNQRVCWNLLLLDLPVNFCSRVSFHLVDLCFLLYPRPPPSFIFNTYVVVERKYNMILGLAFQFRCLFLNGTSRVSVPGIIRLVSKMGSALWVLLFQMN